MKLRLPVRGSAAAMLLCTALLALQGAAPQAQAASKGEPSWAVEGRWVETCSCSIPCPCWKSTPAMPTHADCGDMLFFHVVKGHYGPTQLDGINVVQVAVSADHKVMDQSAQDKDFKINYLYLPSDLSPEVAAAAEAVFGRLTFFPLAVASRHEVKHVPMRVELGADRVKVTIPKVLDAEIAQVKDPSGKPKPFPYDITAVPYLKAGIQGVSVRYVFHDGGLSWSHKGTNGTWSDFAYSSTQLPLPWEQAPAPPAQPAKK